MVVIQEDFQVAGKVPHLRDSLKIFISEGARAEAHHFRITAGIPSGPGVYEDLTRLQQHSWMLSPPLQPTEAVVLQHEQQLQHLQMLSPLLKPTATVALWRQRQHLWMRSPSLQPTATVVLWRVPHFLADVLQQRCEMPSGLRCCHKYP